MEVLDRVKCYKQDLEKPQKNEFFNLWGFLFSSFFYLYVGVLGWFILFFFLPIVLSVALSFVLNGSFAIFAGYLISHLISGFVATKAHRKYKEEYVKKFENLDIDINRPVEYFSISLKRLVILTLLSGGIYTIYWGYRNWNSYQETTKDDVNPLIKAWFFNLTVISLFSKMARTLKPKKSYVIYGVLCLLNFIVSVFSFSFVSEEMGDVGTQLVVIVTYFLLMCVYPLFLIPIQRDVNKYTENHLKKAPEKNFSMPEIIVVVFGIILNYMVWFGNPFSDIKEVSAPELSEEQQEKIGHIIGFVYRHTEGYSKACAKQGYEMKKYPAEFKAYFAKDLDVQKAKVAEYGYMLEYDDEEKIDPELEAEVEESVLEELEALRKIYIRYIISEHEKVPFEEIGWNDEWKELLSLKDVCEIFDRDGIAMLKAGKNKNFINERSL